MAVKSAGDIDPYAAQRALIKRKQVNRKHSKMLEAIRSSSVNRDGPTLPKYLKRSIAASKKTEEVDTKLVNPKRTINKMISKYL